MDNRHTLVEAAERFSVKPEETRPNIEEQSGVLLGSLSPQLRLFAAYLDSECDKRIIDAMQDEMDMGMGARIVKELSSQEMSEQFGVFYKRERDGYKPEFIVDIKAVEEMADIIDPLFSLEENLTAARKMELSASLVMWMGLAGWVFDGIDPRTKTEFQEYSGAHLNLAKLANVDAGDFDNDQIREEKIDEAMTVLRYRFMGILGYAGLIKNCERMDLEIERKKVSTSQSLFTAFFNEQAQQNPSTVTKMQFALAFPLKKNEAREMVEAFFGN